MGKPIDPCFVPNNPYQSFAPTANVTTTPPPPPPYYVLPQSGVQCVNPPCVCGSVFLPMGPCVNILIASGSNSLSYNLQHPVDVLLEQEQILITTTPLIVAGGNFYANNLNISFNSFCTTTTTTTSPVMGNFANYNGVAIWNGSSSKLTTVGTNGGPSTYGTYDQSGNVFEWTDLDGIVTDRRGYSGGYWALDASYMSNLSHLSIGVNGYALGFEVVGFRIASLNNPLQLLNFVSVGNAGNIAEIYTFIDSNSNISKSYGAVDYNYKIGALLVTNDDYVVFLNAAAKSDPYGLYDSRMPITRSGNNESYTYLVQNNYNKKPVVYVSWFDCARYCNWLHNNRGDGSTETGAYSLLNGQTTTGIAPAKNAGANYYIPTENEWHKAAYYSPNYGGAGVGGYWTYATQSNTPPTPVCATPTGDGTPCGAITTTLPPTPPVGTLQNTIQIVVKLKDSKQIIGYQVLGSTNSSTNISNINIPFIDTVDLNNQILQLEFYSLCSRDKTCCDNLPTLSLNSTVSSLSCTTTTTTTLPPFCNSINLADSFIGPVTGVGVFAGQVNYNSVWNRVGNVWTTTGNWPCGIPYEFSITCDPTRRRLMFDGNIPCARGFKTVDPPSATGLASFTVTYPDLNNCSSECCYGGCDNCDHRATCGGSRIDLTTTTLPPWCSSQLPDSFECRIVGHGALIGQEKVSTVTRTGNVWSTSGTFPCGADYNISMTCNSASQNFTYDGSMSCCVGRKNIVDPSNAPYLKPLRTAPPIIWYADCSNCSPTCNTSTSTTLPPPTIDCSSTDPLIIKGYAFYNSAAGSQNIPGIGNLQAPCFGGHNCNNINFVPQLISGGLLGQIDANKSVSLNNGSDINNPDRSDTFQFDIRIASEILNKRYNTKLNLKGGTYIENYVTKSVCHDIATWIVLTTEINGQTVLLFNDCIFTDTPVDLNYECIKCCSWDGVGSLDLTVGGCTIQESLQFLQLSDNLWEVNQRLSCGDIFKGIISCDPNIPYTGENSCYTKWTFQSFSLPCATNLRLTGGILTPCECAKPPVWEFAADSLSNCLCCLPRKIGYTHYTMGNAPLDSEWYYVETIEDLQKCKVLITAQDSTTIECGQNTSLEELSAHLSGWVNNGGVYLYQEEWSVGTSACGNIARANLTMGTAGSSLTSRGGFWSSSQSFAPAPLLNGYTATTYNSPCVSGLTFYGAVTASIVGGVPLIYAPSGLILQYPEQVYLANPGAMAMAGEIVGEGCVILLGDLNIPIESPTSWTEFLNRLLTIPSQYLLNNEIATSTTLPPYFGACYFASGTFCQDTSQYHCVSSLGEFMGSGTSCSSAPYTTTTTTLPPSGACYSTIYGCYQATQYDCEYWGGTFSGADTQCTTSTTLPPSGILVEFNYNFHPKIDVLIY